MAGADQPSVVTVYLAPRGTISRGVADVLRDWSAAGLVGDYLWVDAGAIEVGRPLHAATLSVSGGRATHASLQEHLARRQSLQRIRLCAITVLGAAQEGVDLAVAGAVFTALSTASSAISVTPVHCLSVRHGSGGWRPDVVWFGWHNVVISPEDSWHGGADGMSVQVGDGRDELDLACHAAAGIAGVSGLWAGVDRAPFDQLRPPGAPTVVVGRSFLRRLDATEVGDAVRTRLLDVSRGLPRPHLGGSAAAYYDEPTGPCAKVADDVTRKYAQLFAAREEPMPVQSAVQIGAWAALKLFFGFLLSALRSAPRAWLDGVLHGVATAAAGRVQKSVFGGQDSSYEVVVRGVTATGTPPGLADLSRTADRLAAALQQTIPTGEDRMTYTAGFWKDVAGAALMLADGGSHVAGVTVPVAGDRAGVVRNPAALAPAPGTAFRLTGAAAAEIGVDEIPAYDLRAARATSHALRAAAEANPAIAFDAQLAHKQLREWFEAPTATFVGQVGTRVFAALDSSTQRVARLLGELEQALADQQVPVPLLAGAARLGRTLRILSLLAVLGVLGVVALAVLGVIGLLVTVGLVLAVLAVWFAGSAIAFFRSTQARFALDHARRAAGTRVEVLERNLGLAVRDLQLHAVLYGQYLHWAPVLAKFLFEPFGRREARPTASSRLVGPFPQSVGLGVALTDADHVESVVAELSGRTFERGWMRALWESVTQTGARDAARATRNTAADPEALYADRGVAEDSMLHWWATTVLRDGVPAATGDAAWALAVRTLTGRGVKRLCEELFSGVRPVGQSSIGAFEPVTGVQFLTDVARGVSARRPFDRDLFSSASLVESAGSTVQRCVVVADEQMLAEGGSAGWGGTDGPQVERVSPLGGSRRGLDQFVLVVEVSAGLAPHQLQLLDTSRPTPAPRSPADGVDVTDPQVTTPSRPPDDDGRGDLSGDF